MQRKREGSSAVCDSGLKGSIIPDVVIGGAFVVIDGDDGATDGGVTGVEEGPGGAAVAGEAVGVDVLLQGCDFGVAWGEAKQSAYWRWMVRLFLMRSRCGLA